ncbi:UNVERIFIED_CONTAM: hypothetical protein GTU68_025119 [Idotea baltica]|nr:hypothetical protein [Idotea baltica]
MLSLLDYKNDYPGVAYHNQIDVWKSICPDPNLLFKNSTLNSKKTVSNGDLINYRKQHLGKSLSLHYKTPIKMVRGAGQYLVDQYGRKYLDTVNNVAHVGHENPNVVKAGQQQMALLNTNSRYLHDNINALAHELLETLPPQLRVLHFVNSGSEANELAVRMAKAYTNEKDIIASQVGYHGNTNICVDISSYKFDGKGGKGIPKNTHIFPLPDIFRGKYRQTVACTQKVADAFANGMEYFNTFGGNPVSCAIGVEVLKTVKRENLKENALLVGEFLKAELKKLSKDFPIIGDVRGQGLFLGIELVDQDLNPLAKQTDYLANRMKDFGILMSTDGPDYNVLKIKPPMVFTIENAKELIFYLKKILSEDYMIK